jgi:hypothetical protein
VLGSVVRNGARADVVGDGVPEQLGGVRPGDPLDRVIVERRELAG